MDHHGIWSQGSSTNLNGATIRSQKGIVNSKWKLKESGTKVSNGKYIILVIENGPTDTGKSGFRWNYRGRQVVQTWLKKENWQNGKRQLQKDQSVYKGYSEDIINSVIKITTNF